MNEEEWRTTADVDAMLSFLGARLTRRKILLLLCTAARLLRPYWSGPSFLYPKLIPGWIRLAELHADLIIGGKKLARNGRPGRFTADALVREVLGAIGPYERMEARRLRSVWRDLLRSGRESVNAERLAEVCRDQFEPFAHVHPDPHWLVWNNGAADRLARHIYDRGAFDEMPILADALEDAGCGEEFLLDHLRHPGPHFRGCWALDVLLGRGV